MRKRNYDSHIIYHANLGGNRDREKSLDQKLKLMKFDEKNRKDQNEYLNNRSLAHASIGGVQT